MIKKIGSVVCVALCLLLSSCATQLKPSPQSIPRSQQWQADGVFAYRDNQNGFSAGYVWKNTDGQYDINIIGPLGAWRATLKGNQNCAYLATSDGKIHKSGAPKMLMQKNLGWSIPVGDLVHWLWSEPNPTLSGLISKNADGQVVQIQQAGWVIQYSQFAEYNGQTVPNHIVLTQGSKKIIVVIQHRS